MFRKLLIANRGEIACRIIGTARRMGLGTVAVYSDADRSALHVEMADEAVHIGPAPSAESYLCIERIVEAARITGAEAIHPGYGFLSENPDFVEAVEKAGLVFVGPSAKAIRAMGLKDAAKALMEKAGVPVVPGYHGEAQELVVLAGKAGEIGFPVLIKARAGGGGKGMRRVDRQADFADALSAAKREARSAFGDDRVLVEKFVATPRHIEIQVFGDSHGNAVHLYERDCSLQRRHQKVIEEAPAPGMTEEMRAAMGAAAVEAARAIDYCGAGTVEFIVDASDGLRPDRFWFMEMNTRLQVEHPVTELVTGLDLVEWQLRVAAGEPLPLLQEALPLAGHAVEARLYAEDPARGFLPATGRIAHIAFPEGLARVDSGVRSGDDITPHYDPMIAKLIAHAPTRMMALARLHAALAGTRIAGTTTNLAFLKALCRHPGFARGAVDTGLIDRDGANLVARPAPPRRLEAAAAIIASGMARPAAGSDPFDRLGAWSLWGMPTVHATIGIDGAERHCRVGRRPDGFWQVDADDAPGEPVVLSLMPEEDGRHWRLGVDGRRQTIMAMRGDGVLTLFLEGDAFRFTLPEETRDADADAAGGDVVIAPMPGIVKQVLVAAGDAVEAGQALVVLEAMKMELSLPAPRAGTIARLVARQGAQVADGAVLIELETDSAAEKVAEDD